MKITIGFSKPKAHGMLFSKLIRLFEGTEYSHVFIKMETRYGIDVVYHASGSKVNFMNYELFTKQAIILDEFSFEIDRDTKDRILNFCFTYVGTDYGIKQIAGMAIARLFKLRNPFSDGLNTMVCTEVVGHILQVITPDFNVNDFDNLGVKDIHMYLQLKEQLPI